MNTNSKILMIADTVAGKAFLYAHGASIQTARDYLGHENEQMTLQYCDTCRQRSEMPMKNILVTPKNNLAASLKRKEDTMGSSQT